jgi:glycosyl transferase family 25
VINLKRSVERRVEMTRRLDALGIPHEFFEAVEGSTLDLRNLPAYDSMRRRLLFGRDLRPGEVGCLLSHRGIYQRMVERGIERALILEDDVFLNPDFPQVVRALQTLPVSWDMIRFLQGEKIYKRSRSVCPVFGAYELARPGTSSGGAFCYLLALAAAKRLLEHTQKNVLPIDALHSYVWRTGLDIYSVKPSPVTADTDDPNSTIGAARFDKKLQLEGWQKLVYPVTRAWLRVSEAAGKRSAYLLSWPRDAANRRRLARQKA